MSHLSSIPSVLHTNQTAPSSPALSTSFFSLNTGYRLFTSSKNQPDPDQEDILWNEPEQYSAAVSRKEYGRDGSGLPSIRGVLARKVTPSRLIGDDEVSSSTPKASADIAVSVEVVEGVVNGPSAQRADELLHEYDEVTPTISRQETPKPRPISNTDPIDCLIQEEKRPPTISNQEPQSVLSAESLPPALPAKDGVVTRQEAVATSPDPTAQPAPLPNPSSFSISLTTGLNSAMKYISGPELPSRFLVRSQSNSEKPALRPADMHTIDDQPHIRYDWTMGKRVKFSCTVYYARQFELLRKKCGVHEIFVTSLTKSANWAAEGGKSKSNFWKTSDDRFIIKTLVNAWNVADLSVCLSPSPPLTHYQRSGKC